MSTKHTPGPWECTRNPENTRWIIDSAPYHAIACTAGYEPDNEAMRLYMTALGGGKSYLGRCAVRPPSWVAWRVDMGRMSKAATASERRQVSWRRVF